jgi:drug/metabolite transporter (DMT)-like permease
MRSRNGTIGRAGSTPSGPPAPLGAAAVGALVIVYVVWGSTYLGIRYVVASLPPYLSAGVRFAAAGALLYPFAIRRGTPEERAADAPTRQQWLSAFVIGGLLLGVGNGGVSDAERHVPSGTAALLVAMVPLWMALFGWLFFRDRLTPWAVVGLLVGFGGVALLAAGGGGEHGGAVTTSGLMILIIATIAWSAGSLFARSAPMPSRPLLGTAMEMLAGGVVCVALGTAFGEWPRVRLGSAHTSAWLALAYLVLFGSLVAYSAYTWLLRHAPTPVVATYAYVNPAVAVFLGWLIGGEHIYPRTIGAAAIVIGGVALIVSAPRLAQRRELRRRLRPEASAVAAAEQAVCVPDDER